MKDSERKWRKRTGARNKRALGLELDCYSGLFLS